MLRLRFAAIRHLILMVMVVGFGLTLVQVVFPARAEAIPICAPFICNRHGGSWWTYGVLTGAQGLDLCHTVPAPQMPGSGLSGWIDPGPAVSDPNAIDVYGSVEYPPPWATYDLGCAGTLIPSGATLDTQIGNWLKGVGTTIVALCNSLHRFVTPPTFMQGFNPVLLKATAALRDAVYKPYIGLALLLVGLGIIYLARKRNMPKAVETFIWALLVMGIATALWSWPVRAGNAVDATSTAVIGNINAAVLGNPVAGADPSTARADLLTDNVLYRQWLVGELGSSDSAVAQKYGRLLLLTQTYTYAEAKQIQTDPAASAKITKQKHDDFQKLAQAVQHEDAGAYEHLKGSAGGRIGQGAVTTIAAILTAPFMILADIIQVVALFIIRLLVIFSPVIAVPGIFIAMRNMVINLFSRGLGASVNAVFFAVGSAVNALIVGVFLGGGNNGLPMWAAIFLCGIVTALLWAAFKPARKLGQMVNVRNIANSTKIKTSTHKTSTRRRFGRFMHRRREHEATEALQKIAELLEHQKTNPTSSEPTRVIVVEMPEGWTRNEPVEASTIEPVEPEPVAASEPVEPGYDPDFVPPEPYEARHSDPVTASGGVQWRVWDPDTGTYEVVDEEMPDTLPESPRSEVDHDA